MEVRSTDVASNGDVIFVSGASQTLNYNADGTLNYVEVSSGGNTYRQTMSYTSGNLTGVSAWVKQ